MIWNPRHVKWLVALLGLLTLVSAIWPVYRSFLIADININEAWNAYFADAAYRGSKLYPSRDQFITNNYPPVGFYILGASGALVGDTVLTGRLLSLLAIAAIAIAAGLIVRHWNGSRTSALVGGLFCASGICRFFPGYAGMNDPQLLAQAVMAIGFLGFLKAIEKDRGYLVPLVVMIFSGFIKHNIIAMPIVAFLWLGLQRPKRFLPLTGVSTLVIVLGFALCHFAYGLDFWRNLRTPRSYNARLALDSLAVLQWPLVALVVWVYAGIALRNQPVVKFCNVWVIVSLLAFVLQRASEGVAENAMFDLVIALSVGIGIAFAKAHEMPLARHYNPERLRAGVLMAICIRLLTTPGNEPARLFFDPGFQEEIAMRDAAMRESVAKAKETPGDVLSAAIVSYRAGKPFIVDTFNFQQRVKAGELSNRALEDRIAAGTLTRVQANPYAAWCNSLGSWGRPRIE